MINTEQLSEYVTGSNIWVNVLVYILRTCVVTDTNLCTLVSVKDGTSILNLKVEGQGRNSLYAKNTVAYTYFFLKNRTHFRQFKGA